jgi:hypothetical protein
MARNQVRSGSLVELKIVPAIGEVCRRHCVHWNKLRIFTLLRDRPLQIGHENPAGCNHNPAALLVCAVQTTKFSLAQPSLKLHRIPRHRFPPLHQSVLVLYQIEND